VRVRVVLLSETLVGLMTVVVTVTEQVAVIPLDVEAVIVAVPALTAVTFPLFTVATELSEEDQVTFLLLVFSGKTVAESSAVFPVARLRAV
jgi:hypothetical protein